jgi:integrase
MAANDIVQTQSTPADHARERGAESSGEFPGGSWRVFAITEHGKQAHVLLVTISKGVRKKLRVPKKYASVDERMRFAKAAAPEMKKQHDAALKTAGQDGAPSATNPAAITFDEFARLWTSGKLTAMYPGHVKAKRTVAADVQRLKFMKSMIGDVALRDFRVQHAEQVLAALPKKRSSATLRHYAQTIHRVLSLAVYPGKLLAHHPLPDGFLPSVGPRRAMSFLYPSEDAALMACTAVPLQRRVLYGVLAREGMRFGEAASLQWSDVDLATGVVVLDRTKTSEPRSWKLGDDVVSTLTSYKKTHPSRDDETGHIFVDEAAARSSARSSRRRSARISSSLASSDLSSSSARANASPSACMTLGRRSRRSRWPTVAPRPGSSTARDGRAAR